MRPRWPFPSGVGMAAMTTEAAPAARSAAAVVSPIAANGSAATTPRPDQRHQRRDLRRREDHADRRAPLGEHRAPLGERRVLRRRRHRAIRDDLLDLRPGGAQQRDRLLAAVLGARHQHAAAHHRARGHQRAGQRRAVAHPLRHDRGDPRRLEHAPRRRPHRPDLGQCSAAGRRLRLLPAGRSARGQCSAAGRRLRLLPAGRRLRLLPAGRSARGQCPTSRRPGHRRGRPRAGAHDRRVAAPRDRPRQRVRISPAAPRASPASRSRRARAPRAPPHTAPRPRDRASPPRTARRQSATAGDPLR